MVEAPGHRSRSGFVMGFRVQGFGLRVQSLGFAVLGCGFRYQVSGFGGRLREARFPGVPEEHLAFEEVELGE